jgi:hypothetical protein
MGHPPSLKDRVLAALRREGVRAGYTVDGDSPVVVVHYADPAAPIPSRYRDAEGGWERGREARLADCRRTLEPDFAVESIEWQGRDALRVTERG